MTRAFILGAGFSALQGFPLVRDLRPRVEDFLRDGNDPLYGGLYSQYQEVAQELDPHGELAFEGLFIKMLKTLPDPNNNCALRCLRGGAARVLWNAHNSYQEVHDAYRNFGLWLKLRDSHSFWNGIVSFNWDVLVEQGLKAAGIPWSYSTCYQGASVIKPHGSINWNRHLRANLKPVEYHGWARIDHKSCISFIQDEPLEDPDPQEINQYLRYMLFPGAKELSTGDEDLSLLWEQVREIIGRSESVIFIGYSLPDYDLEARNALVEWIGKREIEVYSPAQDTLNKYRLAFGPTANLKLHAVKFEDCLYSGLPSY